MGDDLSTLAGVGLSLECDAGDDVDSRRGSSYSQGEVDTLAARDGDPKIDGGGIREAGLRDQDVVLSDAERGNFVLAAGVGGAGADDGGGDICDRDGRIGMTAPELSRTVPTMLPFSNWAKLGTDKESRQMMAAARGRKSDRVSAKLYASHVRKTKGL